MYNERPRKEENEWHKKKRKKEMLKDRVGENALNLQIQDAKQRMSQKNSKKKKKKPTQRHIKIVKSQT